MFQREARLAKVELLRRRGVNPYPSRFARSCTLGELRRRFASLEPGEETESRVSVAGRVMLVRLHGRLAFATLRDESGDVQLFMAADTLGAERLTEITSLVDVGDWVGAEGTVMTTRRGELSVRVEELRVLAKAIRPLPDKWHGLTDTDTRFRQRYVDLIVNPEARRIARLRSRVVAALREYLDERGFMEVETPVLQTVHGGANARPFVTHYNALEIDTYLRIALELPLKRLVVGGFEKVYEIGRVFRNEGLDARHNPEFTMLEVYEAFADFEAMMVLVEGLVAHAAARSAGSTTVDYCDHHIDLSPPWERRSMYELIAERLGVDMHPSMPVTEARRTADRLDVPTEERWGAGRVIAEIFDKRVQRDLVGPVIVYGHPREVSPLAKADEHDPDVVERFEVIVAGSELANAYSELNDPVEQLIRLRHEQESRQAGDDEAGEIDHDYIRALEYGLPPTGGLGVGVDRLVMLLAGVSSIREVILFPTLKPERHV
ncbi:MAG: lysine--tRNA ligase [Acidimicrobiales bacterium]|nr:MAG: lysine--tRNA ligase [Acidimicrobiales bacterium]